MNWWQENWFTTLPKDVQEKYYSAYVNGDINDSDIINLKKLPAPVHPRVQSLPPAGYSQSIKNMLNMPGYKNFDRAAEMAAGKTGKQKLDPFSNFAFSQLSNMAKAAKAGGGYAQVLGAAAASVPNALKDFGDDASNFVFGKFFECFKGKYFNLPIRSINPQSKMNGTCAEVFCAYAIGQYMFSKGITRLDLNDEAFKQNAGKIVSIVFKKDVDKIAENLWVKGMRHNLLMTMASMARDTMFVLTDIIQKKLGVQTFNLIVPPIKRMGEGAFDTSIVLNGIAKINMRSMGGAISNNVIDFGWRAKSNIKELINTTASELRVAEQKIRDECLKQLKGELGEKVKNMPTINREYKAANESWNTFKSKFDKIVEEGGWVPGMGTSRSASDKMKIDANLRGTGMKGPSTTDMAVGALASKLGSGASNPLTGKSFAAGSQPAAGAPGQTPVANKLFGAPQQLSGFEALKNKLMGGGKSAGAGLKADGTPDFSMGSWKPAGPTIIGASGSGSSDGTDLLGQLKALNPDERKK